MNGLQVFGLLLPAGFICVVLSQNGRKEGEGIRSDVKSYMSIILKSGNWNEKVNAVDQLEQVLMKTNVDKSTSFHVDGLVACLYKVKGAFSGLQLEANDSSVSWKPSGLSRKVSVRLPQELRLESGNTVAFYMLPLSNQNQVTTREGELYEGRLVGLSVSGKEVSNLQQPVNITIRLSSGINESQTPSCVFLNTSTETFSRDGCTTIWERGWSSVTCSCNHLTYFGVLLLGSGPLSARDQEILSYITLIGCSLSLCGLLLTLLLFILNRKARNDVSVKIHLNLSVALILLNSFFLSSPRAADPLYDGLCLYVALSLHYALLATFSWMALEGFHLYLLLVKVFNIYIRRYLLKLCLVGWGVPAVIVTLVAIVDSESYGRVLLDSSNSESAAICYITNYTVKMVTTMGVFSLVFVFNGTMLAVTVRRFVSLSRNKELGQRNHSRAKKDICSLLGIITLLGTTWGLAFFSFGPTTVVALYPFCILNSLQGFFIFLWFVMSVRNSGDSTPTTSNVTRSTNS